MVTGQEYFQEIEQHEVKFQWQGDQDGEAIDLAFNKKRADDRKDERSWGLCRCVGYRIGSTTMKMAWSPLVRKCSQLVGW